MANNALIKKLQIKAGARATIINPPESYIGELGGNLPASVHLESKPQGCFDFVQIFVQRAKVLDSYASKIPRLLKKDGILWISYPKKSSGLITDISRDKGMGALHNIGFRPVSQVSLNDVWSAIRFRRKADVDGVRGKITSRIRDDTVREKTQMSWQEWFASLNASGCGRMTHKEIVAYLRKNHNLTPWWQQMVTVMYELYVKKREKHRKEIGYEISVSRTIQAPVKDLYNAWLIEKIRKLWLPQVQISIRKATQWKSMRITWKDGKTSLEVNFYPKGGSKCQITVQHSKLPDSRSADRMKKYWAEKLELLKKIREKDA